MQQDNCARVTFICRDCPDHSLCTETRHTYKKIADLEFVSKEELVSFCSLHNISIQTGAKQGGVRVSLLRAEDSVSSKIGIYTLVRMEETKLLQENKQESRKQQEQPKDSCTNAR